MYTFFQVEKETKMLQDRLDFLNGLAERARIARRYRASHVPGAMQVLAGSESEPLQVAVGDFLMCIEATQADLLELMTYAIEINSRLQ